MGNPLSQIFGVGIQRHPAGTFESTKRGKGCLQLHPVVGGLGITPANYFFVAAITEDCCPTTWAGIGVAGSVAENYDAFLLHVFSLAQRLQDASDETWRNAAPDHCDFDGGYDSSS
jgi:hypothetical protein